MAESLLSTVPGTRDLFLAYMGEAAFRKVLSIARNLRREGFNCHIEFGGGSLKSQMRLANRLNAQHALIIGESELARNLCTIRRMDNSDQREISPDEIGGYLRSHRK